MRNEGKPGEPIITRRELYKKIESLEKENAELKARLNPQTLYGIENGKVFQLLNVVVEYHFDRGGWIEADDIGKYVFLTKAEAEKALKEKRE